MLQLECNASFEPRTAYPVLQAATPCSPMFMWFMSGCEMVHLTSVLLSAYAIFPRCIVAASQRETSLPLLTAKLCTIPHRREHLRIPYSCSRPAKDKTSPCAFSSLGARMDLSSAVTIDEQKGREWKPCLR